MPNEIYKKIALLIGVGEYGEGVPPLLAPPNDIEAMKRVLENPEMGGFDQVKILNNPDLGKMQRAIEKLFKDSNKDDLVLLFFSGHGKKNTDGHLHLFTNQTDKDTFLSTSVPASFIQRISKNSNYAKRQVIILDCCYSGAFSDGWQPKSLDIDLNEELGAVGRVVLTSSSKFQTSFEHENLQLSVYTQYLVEGIETGGADTNSDGKIYIHELHNYAKTKVQEVRPTMEPEIIIDREGYNILLSKAPVNDPSLKFRQEVEKRAKNGEISQRSSEILKVKQSELKLADEKAEEIISSVLKPYQLYRENLKRYEEEYRQEVLKNYHLSEDVAQELEEWATVCLCLRDTDVEKIQQQIVSEINKKVQESVPKLSTPTLEIQSISVPAPPQIILESEKGIDYTPLQDLLAAGKWKEADEKTYHLVLKAANCEEEGYLNSNNWLNFPCKDLRTIDQLWVQYSKGRFGFSIQKQIWESVGGNVDADSKLWFKFGDKVGWRKGGNWLSKDVLTFNPDTAPCGHLPGGLWEGLTVLILKWGWSVGIAFLAERLVTCNI